MFTENEVSLMIENPNVVEHLLPLKKDFLKSEAQFLEISDHDFLSLVLLSPSVGIALANGSVSLFEELALNKRARQLSKGGYFMKKDPVVIAMGYLIKHYDNWEMKFMEYLRGLMNQVLNLGNVDYQDVEDEEITPGSFRKEVLKAPYGFVRFLSSFFCSEDVDIINAENRTINKVEFDKVLDIGNKLELNRIPIFRHFCATYNVK